MPPTKMPMRSRKVPPPPPPKAPDVTPPAPMSIPLTLAGSAPDVDDDAPRDRMAKARETNNTPAANKKRSQSLQVSHSIRRMLGLTPIQFEIIKGSPQTLADEMAIGLIDSARNGTMDAIKTILERTEGRVPQALEVNSTAHKELNERVSDIARDRANSAAIAAAGGSVSEVSSDLDLPEDGADSPEGDERKPGVAGKTAS